MSLSRAVLEKFAELEGCARIVYGTATGDNIVPIGDSTSTAATPALTPVTTGDYCAVMEAINGDRLILGSVDGVGFLPINGSSPMTGDLDLDGNSIVGVVGMETDGLIEIVGTNANVVVNRSTTADSASAKISGVSGLNKAWNFRQLVVDAPDGGADAINFSASMSFRNDRSTDAVIVELRRNATQELRVRNAAGSADASMRALAFNATSTVRTKQNVEDFFEDRLLEIARGFRLKRWKTIARPESTHTNEDGTEGFHVHDCSIDGCDGTADAPCAAILNDTHRVGPTAEDVAGPIPEITILDEHGQPDAVDIGQQSGLALGVAAMNTRRIDEQQRVIEALCVKLSTTFDDVLAELDGGKR